MHYIFHSTSKENIINTLEDGTLYANKYIDSTKRRLSPNDELPYIYTLLYTPLLKYNFWSYGLILHPKILEIEPTIFNYGWITHPNDKSIYIYSTDDHIVKNKKIKQIVNYVDKTTKMTQQEILFIGCIKLKDYLIGILCPNCDDENIKKIKLLLSKNNMKNVKIYVDEKMPYIKN